jgi:tight adherence protein C
MDFAQLVPWAIFGGISLAAWVLVSRLAGSSSRASERLEELRDPKLRNRAQGGQRDSKGGVGAVLQKAAPKLSKALGPRTELEQNKLKISLANAGFNSPNAPQLFLAIKVGAALLGLLLGAGSGFTIYGFTAQGGYVLAGCAGAGFYLPELVLWFLKSKRMERIFLAMPDALDLLVVCVEAGLGLDAAMRRVAEELGDSANARDVCTEFNLCNMQLQMGRARREVLHDLGVRSGVDDMRALAAILIQADKFGSSIAQALRVQSDSMRIKRSQLAEEAAQKTAVKMIFPLVLFIFPGIFVVLVGPAAIQMMRNLITQ